MTRLAIHLLGRPRVERDGAAVPGPRGHKAWGVLAYLLLAERPPSRDELVSLLFSEADDPFAALRWNLSAVRRLLGAAELTGDPLRLSLPRGTLVDVQTLTSGSWVEALEVPGIERELLEGIGFSSSPAFEIWLVTERRHFGAAAEAVLREAALARLATGDPRGAAELAARLVRANPLDENYHVLLVRSLAAGGEGIAAARQVARCTELLRRELGVEPSPALAAAAQTRHRVPDRGTGQRAARREGAAPGRPGSHHRRRARSRPAMPAARGQRRARRPRRGASRPCAGRARVSARARGTRTRRGGRGRAARGTRRRCAVRPHVLWPLPPRVSSATSSSSKAATSAPRAGSRAARHWPARTRQSAAASARCSDRSSATPPTTRPPWSSCTRRGA